MINNVLNIDEDVSSAHSTFEQQVEPQHGRGYWWRVTHASWQSFNVAVAVLKKEKSEVLNAKNMFQDA